MEEIGSEFWDIPTMDCENDLFPKDTKWFLSGRVALKAIIQDIKMKKSVSVAALPSWCCDSMIIPFLQENIRVVFYSVFLKDGKLVQETDLVADVILVMDYFGYTSEYDFSGHNGIIIRDLTHSLISNGHFDADYYFGSIRKWCGCWTGGFAYGDFEYDVYMNDCKNSLFVKLRKEGMAQKKSYINGFKKEKNFLYLFTKAEEDLDDVSSVVNADSRDIEMIKRLDMNYIKKRRRENAEVLHRELSSILLMEDLKEIFKALDGIKLFN